MDGRKFIYFTTNVHDGSAYCLEDKGDTYETRWVWNPPEPDNQYFLHGMAISDGFVYCGTDYGRFYALQSDWREEWFGENSDGGTDITTTELQGAIHHWLDDLPVRGHILSVSDLQEIIAKWLT